MQIWYVLASTIAVVKIPSETERFSVNNRYIVIASIIMYIRLNKA